MASKPLANEAELLAKIAQGDHYAFTILYKHYHGFVNAFGKKLTYSADLSGEIVQDIFLKIWLDRERLVEIENFGGYLNRLVRNKSFDLLRKIAQDAKSTHFMATRMTESDESTLRQIDFKDTEKLLHEVVSQLPAQQRLAYELCHVQGMKYEDVAKEMNVTPETVHSHMKRALKKIREHFRKNALAYPALFAVLFK
ncbi:RNA polymerase sigma-70 factor [Pedobacter sp.]|jgi:RNA polymerase sigma-70 factor (family 1)|uniref:RNA polymerase sigma-70 factor n=1 Tax=Pedobacter sp. TaxID=1411316 RepID=UPI002CA040F1|nr:RNA polymerase sigma-70 factor [Pedobacter sp.]HWW43152.1 RNA polymerase sigma-70 factor [Pedobacter sp.]